MILVIDDDGYIRNSIVGILQSEGYNASSCADPQDGYERCVQNPSEYGLVFIDIHFPTGCVGYEFGRRISRIRERGGPRVIGMTGHTDLYAYERRIEFGMVDVMLKPIFKNLILNLTRRHLSLHGRSIWS